MSGEPASSQLSDKGQGRCSLAGALTLESAPWLWKELQAGLLYNAREADLSGVGSVDSAGLALLVAWKAHCRKQGGELAFSGVPASMSALATATGAQALL